LLAVDAGSNELYLFNVQRDGTLVSPTSSRPAARPVNVTISGDVVYVLNGVVGLTAI
jgi:hypothetical protein